MKLIFTIIADMKIIVNSIFNINITGKQPRRDNNELRKERSLFQTFSFLSQFDVLLIGFRRVSKVRGVCLLRIQNHPAKTKVGAPLTPGLARKRLPANGVFANASAFIPWAALVM